MMIIMDRSEMTLSIWYMGKVLLIKFGCIGNLISLYSISDVIHSVEYSLLFVGVLEEILSLYNR